MDQHGFLSLGVDLCEGVGFGSVVAAVWWAWVVGLGLSFSDDSGVVGCGSWWLVGHRGSLW